MEPIKKLVKQATTQIERERNHFAASLNITGTQMSVIDFLSNMPNFTQLVKMKLSKNLIFAARLKPSWFKEWRRGD